MDYKKTTLNLLGFTSIIIVVLIVIYLCIYFWPFMVGILVALMLEKSINFIIKKTKMSRKTIGTIMVILFYIIFICIVYLIISALIKESISISIGIPDIYNEVKIKYTNIYIKLLAFINKAPDTVMNSIYNIGLKLLDQVIILSTDIINGIVNFVMFLPKLMIYIIITFLATLFLVTDRRAILKLANNVFPNKLTKKVFNVVSMSIKSLGGYLKAQCTIICITFVELFIAFLFLKQEYPLTLALIVAIIDALPILGTGTVLIPWAIYSAITGNMALGIGLLVTYVIILIIRQLFEPKIVGKNIGIHPFLTLLAMYIGFTIFGLLGLIIGPVVMVIFKNVFTVMFEVGYFKKLFIYKKEEKEIKKTN